MASKGGGGAGAFVLEIKHSTESHWDQFFSSIFNKVTLRQKILLPVAGWALVWGGTESDLGAGGRGGPTSFNVTFSSAKKVGCFWWNHFCRKGHSLLPLNLNINFDLLFHITCRSIPVCVRSLLVLSLSVEWHFSLTPHSPKKNTFCWLLDNKGLIVLEEMCKQCQYISRGSAYSEANQDDIWSKHSCHFLPFYWILLTFALDGYYMEPSWWSSSS